MSNLPDQPKLPSALNVGIAVGAAIVAWILMSAVLGAIVTVAKFIVFGAVVVGVLWLLTKSDD